MAFVDTIFSLTQNFGRVATGLSRVAAIPSLERTQAALDKVNKARLFADALYKTLYLPPPLNDTATPYLVNPTPPHWEKEVICYGGQNSVVTKITSEGSSNTVIQLLGLNTEAEYYQPFVERISKRNPPNIIIIELPHASEEGYMPDGKTLVEGFEEFVAAALLDPDSKILRAIPPNHKITLLTHSAGSKSFEAAIRKSPERAKFAAQHYGDDSIIHTGIMLDTVGSSNTFNPLRSAAYLWLSDRPNVRTQQLGTTHIDLVWAKSNTHLFDPCYTNQTTRNAFHGQANKMKRSGIEDVEAVQDPQLRDANPHFFSLKRKIIMGALEPCTSTRVAEFYGDIVDGIEVKSVPHAKHNPLMECAVVYGMVARTLR